LDVAAEQPDRKENQVERPKPGADYNPPNEIKGFYEKILLIIDQS